MERYGSIGASPYKIDIVSFSLETRHGIWMAQALIKPKGHQYFAFAGNFTTSNLATSRSLGYKKPGERQSGRA